MTFLERWQSVPSQPENYPPALAGVSMFVVNCRAFFTPVWKLERMAPSGPFCRKERSGSIWQRHDVHFLQVVGRVRAERAGVPGG